MSCLLYETPHFEEPPFLVSIRKRDAKGIQTFRLAEADEIRLVANRQNIPIRYFKRHWVDDYAEVSLRWKNWRGDECVCSPEEALTRGVFPARVLW